MHPPPSTLVTPPEARSALRSPRTIDTFKGPPHPSIVTLGSGSRPPNPAVFPTRIDATLSVDVLGHATGTLSTVELVALSHEVSVEHRAFRPYCVVCTGASTSDALSVQSRSKMSP